MEKYKLNNSLNFINYELKYVKNSIFETYIYFNEENQISISIKVHDLQTNEIFFIDFIELFENSSNNEELKSNILNKYKEIKDNYIDNKKVNELKENVIKSLDFKNAKNNIYLELINEKDKKINELEKYINIKFNNMYILFKHEILDSKNEVYSSYISNKMIADYGWPNDIFDKYNLFSYLKNSRNNNRELNLVEKEVPNKLKKYFKRLFNVIKLYGNNIGIEFLLMDDCLNDICDKYNEDEIYIFPLSDKNIQLVFKSDMINEEIINKINIKTLYSEEIYYYKKGEKVKIINNKNI